jgi:hypothetical protein
MTLISSSSPLTTIQRKAAQKHLKIYQLHSGIVLYLLGPYVMTFLVMGFNGGGYAIGFVTSVMQFTTFFGIIGPAFLSGREFVTNKVFFWKLRGWVCFFYFLIVLMYEKIFMDIGLSDQVTIFLICVVYGLFCLFRSLGMVSVFPVFNASGSPQERGKVLSSYTHFGNIGAVFSLLACYLLLHSHLFEKQNYSLLLLILLGIIFNFIAANEFKKVASIGVIPKMEVLEIIQRIKGYLFDRKLFVLWIVKFFADSMILCFGVTAAYLSKSRGMETSLIFIFSLVMLLGKILGSSISGKISDILGSRPLLFYIHFLIAACGVCLIYFPSSSPSWLLLILLVVVSFLSCFSDILIGQLVYSYSPKQDIISYAATNTLIASMAALFNGFLIGYLLDKKVLGVSNFTGVWILLVFFAFSILFLLLFLKHKEDFSISTVASAFISLKNMRGVFAISALNEEIDQDKKALYLNQIAVINEPYANKEIIRYLKSSNMITRRSAYQALRLNPIPGAFEVVFLEAKREDAYIRDDAIYNLRYDPRPEVETFLRKLAIETNFYGVQAVLSLSYMLNKPDDDLKFLIGERLKTEKIPQYRSRLIYSLTKVADVKYCLEIILAEAHRESSKEFIRFLYISLASKFKWDEILELSYNREDEEINTGRFELISLTTELNDPLHNREWLMNGKAEEINQWLLDSIKEKGYVDEKVTLQGVKYPEACMFFMIALKTSSEGGNTIL